MVKTEFIEDAYDDAADLVSAAVDWSNRIDEHVQRPVEVGASTPGRPRALAGRLQGDPARLGGGVPALHGTADGVGQVHAFAL